MSTISDYSVNQRITLLQPEPKDGFFDVTILAIGKKYVTLQVHFSEEEKRTAIYPDKPRTWEHETFLKWHEETRRAQEDGRRNNTCPCCGQAVTP